MKSLFLTAIALAFLCASAPLAQAASSDLTAEKCHSLKAEGKLKTKAQRNKCASLTKATKTKGPSSAHGTVLNTSGKYAARPAASRGVSLR